MTNDIDKLTALNHDFVASVQNSDVRRFDEILAPEFYSTNPDKSLVDRAAFLEQTAKPVAMRTAGARALHRLLGEAEREMARGIGACDAMMRSRHCRARAAKEPHEITEDCRPGCRRLAGRRHRGGARVDQRSGSSRPDRECGGR